jgi:hypothetical protein
MCVYLAHGVPCARKKLCESGKKNEKKEKKEQGMPIGSFK